MVVEKVEDTVPVDQVFNKGEVEWGPDSTGNLDRKNAILFKTKKNRKTNSPSIITNWAASWQNQKNGMCAQQRLRSAWASAQSDQSLLSVWRKLRSLATHWAHSENSDQTEWMPRLICVFARRTCHFVGFVVKWLISRIQTGFKYCTG